MLPDLERVDRIGSYPMNPATRSIRRVPDRLREGPDQSGLPDAPHRKLGPRVAEKGAVMNRNRMVRKAYDCLAEVLNHEPSEAEYQRLLSAAALRYREVLASNPNLRAHFNDPLITSPEQRWLLENDDATAGWLMIQTTLEANPKQHVVKEFREWMEEP
jgi:hypothetical protein